MIDDSDITDRTRPALLRPEEVAVILGVSLRTVTRYIKLGLIPVIRLSKRTRRVALSDLEEFVARMRELNG